MSRGNQKVRCVNKLGQVKFLMPTVIKAGAAARNGYFPQAAPKSSFSEAVSKIDEEAKGIPIPDIADESHIEIGATAAKLAIPKQDKPKRTYNRKK